MTRRVLIGLELIVALGALPAGVSMVLDPRDGGAPPVRPEWLDGSPFHSYLVPGLFLAGVFGFGLLLAAVLLLRRVQSAPHLSFGLGIALCAWIVIQVTIIPFNFLQPLFFLLGAVIAALAWRVATTAATRTPGGNAGLG